MKEIPLTQGKIALVDDEDYERVNLLKWHLIRPNKKQRDKCYSEHQICEIGKRIRYYMHRFIMNIDDPNIEIDHIDNNGLNCQKENLRLTKRNQNMSNRQTKNKNNTSGFRGVYWHKNAKKWMVSIQFKRKQIYMGLFTDKEEAARAFDKKARELFGEYCGKLNFPEKK